jgi:hypothetical protein
MASLIVCRRCGAALSRSTEKFCPACGTPVSLDFPVKHEDAIREFGHHESVLQNYRAMFLVSETFTASLAASRAGDPQSHAFVLLLAAFGISWLVIWVVVTTLRARVVRFFEEHDEDGALMRYHQRVEKAAHSAGFWFLTVVFPASFLLFWVSLLALTYHVL